MIRNWRMSLLVAGCLAIGGLLAQFGPWTAMAADPPSKSSQAHFKIVVTPLAAEWTSVRWNPKTGESWRLLGTSWVKLEYSDPPQPGDYEVLMYTLKTNTWVALLFDHVSGATWELTDKWNKVGEPK